MSLRRSIFDTLRMEEQKDKMSLIALLSHKLWISRLVKNSFVYGLIHFYLDILLLAIHILKDISIELSAEELGKAVN